MFVEGGAPVPWHNGQSKSDVIVCCSNSSDKDACSVMLLYVVTSLCTSYDATR